MWNVDKVSFGVKKNEPSAYYNNLISETYDSSWYGGVTATEIQYYLSLMDGKRSFEFPVGTGRLAIPLLHSGCDLYGIDNSPEMLSILSKKLSAQSMGHEAERFILWGALNTPYPCTAKSFGVAVVAFASFSLMHSNMRSPVAENRILKEMNRILQDGGIAVINDYRTAKIDLGNLKSGHVFNHKHKHPIHGDILEEQISDFRIEPNALIPNQVVRYRKNRLVRISDNIVLSESREITPLWDVETFPVLGENAGFEYVEGEVVNFYTDETINHVFRKRHDL